MNCDIFDTINPTKKKYPMEYFLKIPSEDSFSESQPQLKELYTEWRMRKYSIDNKTYFEISFIKGNKSRKYVNNDGKYVNVSIDPTFDKYIVNEKYWYTQ